MLPRKDNRGDPRENLGNGDETGQVDREDDGDDRGTYPDMVTDDEVQWADEQGGTLLVRPKRPTKSGNKPGQQNAAMRGSISNFRPNPNGETGGKGKSSS